MIFVEYLDETASDSQSILLGSMFFQQVYAQVAFSGVSSVNVNLFMNQNVQSSSANLVSTT